MPRTVVRLKHDPHGGGVVERCRDFHQQQEFRLGSDGDGTATVVIFIQQALRPLLLHPQVFDFVYDNTEMMKRSPATLFADIPEEDRDPALCSDVLMLHTDLEQSVLEQNARLRCAEVGKGLPHGWNDLPGDANGLARSFVLLGLAL